MSPQVAYSHEDLPATLTRVGNLLVHLIVTLEAVLTHVHAPTPLTLILGVTPSPSVVFIVWAKPFHGILEVCDQLSIFFSLLLLF